MGENAATSGLTTPRRGDPRTLAVLVAPPRHGGLHELVAETCSAALPFAHGLHLIDFQLANLRRAGILDVIVLQADGRGAERLQRHVRQVWQPVFRRLACLGGPVSPGRGPFDGETLQRCQALACNLHPEQLLLLRADDICAPDLNAMLWQHRHSGAVLTLAPRPGPAAADPARMPEETRIGALMIGWRWLQGYLRRGGEAGLDEAAARGPGLRLWQAPAEGGYWRSPVDLDGYRRAWLAFERPGTPPCPLPDLPADPQARTDPLPDWAPVWLPPRPVLRPRATGVSAATGAGRETVILPGGSIAAGAQVVRAIIAPGARVPAGLVIGRNAAQDAARFRRSAGGTVLVTAEMLAAL